LSNASNGVFLFFSVLTAHADAPLNLIDAHTHTVLGFTPELRKAPASEVLKKYLSDLKAANVVGAIAHSFNVDEGYIDLKAHHVLHCSGVREKTNFSKLEAGLKSGKFGCIKIYLGYVHKFASDPHYRRAYKLAEKYGVTVVFHTGDVIDSMGKLKFADPLTIDEVAVDFRKVKFVIAHAGNPWIQSAAEVAYKNPNVYLEVSALLTGNMDELPKEQVEKYVVEPVRWIFGYRENPEKLLFGTDYPLSDIGAYARAIQRAIPKEHWKAVFHDNAVQVFGLKLPKS
jgi:predicted TIM-barrel fold metal-dependent hydrolase